MSVPETHSWRLPEPDSIRRSLKTAAERIARLLSRRELRPFAVLAILCLVPRLLDLDTVLLPQSAMTQLQGALHVLSGHPPMAPILVLPAQTASPFLAVFLAIPVLLSRDPRVSVAALALLHTVAVLVTFATIRRYHGRRAGWAFCLLFCFAPWMIHASRQIGVPAMVIPLGLLLLDALAVAAEAKSPWAWSVVGALMGLLLLTTWLTLPLLAVIALVAILSGHRAARGHMLLGVLLCAFIAFPTIYADSGSDLVGLRQLKRLLLNSETGAATYGAFMGHISQVVGGRGLPQAVGTERIAIPFLATFSQLLILALLIASVYVMIKAVSQWSSWHRSNWVIYMVPGAWLWTLLLVTVLSPFAYALTARALLFPAGYLVIALGVDDLLLPLLAKLGKGRWWRQAGRAILLVLVAALFAGQWLYVYRIQHQAATQASFFAAPNRFWRRTAALAERGALVSDSAPLWVLLGGADADEAEMTHQVLSFMVEDQSQLAFIRSADEAVSLPVAAPAEYLIISDAPHVEPLLRQLAATRTGSVEFPGTGPTPRLYETPASTIEDTLALVARRGLWRTDAGLQLIGYDWLAGRTDNTPILRTFWGITALLPEEQRQPHQIVAQVVDTEGVIHSTSRTELGVEARDWIEGGVLSQWTEMDMSQIGDTHNELALLVGIYRPEEETLAAHIDAYGNSLGEGILLGGLPALPSAP